MTAAIERPFGRVRGALLLAGVVWVRGAAQTIPPDAIAQFQEAIGARVEAAVILGGDYTANAGAYNFHGGNDATLSVLKLGSAGGVRALQPLGSTGLQWCPALAGTAGFTSASNPFENESLAGNEMKYAIAAAELGVGVKLQLTDRLAVMPMVNGIYGHIENEFRANTPLGQSLQGPAEAAGLINWQATTWTTNPSLEVRYVWLWRGITWEFISRYIYFHTEDLESSSPLVNVDGRSSTWLNKLDVDVPLGRQLWGYDLHTGGYASRNGVFGDLRGGLRSGFVDTVSGRLVLTDVGQILRFKVRWVGLAVTRFWGENFDGWSFGLTMRWSL